MQQYGNADPLHDGKKRMAAAALTIVANRRLSNKGEPVPGGSVMFGRDAKERSSAHHFPKFAGECRPQGEGRGPVDTQEPLLYFRVRRLIHLLYWRLAPDRPARGRGDVNPNAGTEAHGPERQQEA